MTQSPREKLAASEERAPAEAGPVLKRVVTSLLGGRRASPNYIWRNV
jgi:hypothetical protein